MLDVQVEVLQHLFALFVAEGDVLEINVADELGPVFGLGVEIVAVLRHHFGRIHNIGFRFQQADDALRRRLRRLQFREDAGNIAHGLKEADGVVDEHGQRADGHSDAENVRTADDAVAALPEPPATRRWAERGSTASPRGWTRNAWRRKPSRIPGCSVLRAQGFSSSLRR